MAGRALAFGILTASILTFLNPAFANEWQESLTAKVTVAEFPDQQWWEGFKDSYLNDYIQAALKNNPKMAATRIKVEEARAQAGQQLADLLPTASISPSFNRISLPDNIAGSLPIPNPIKLYMLPLNTAYELDLFGKQRNEWQAAKRETDAVAYNSRATEIALTADVTSAYINLLLADQKVKNESENLDLLTQIHALKQNLNQTGIAPYDDVITAERDLAASKSMLSGYQREQSIFAHQLSVLTGVPPENEQTLKRASLSELILPAETAIGIPSELVARRPDVKSRELMLAKAGLDVRAARKAFLPTIKLSAMFSMAGLKFSDAFNWNTLFMQQAANITQPLFQGGRLKSQLKFQKAKYREEVENYRASILDAFKDVEDSLSQLRTGYDDLENNGHRLELTQQEYAHRESLYQQGIIPKLETLQSRSNVLAYEQRNAQSRADVLIATISLYKSLGGGY